MSYHEPYYTTQGPGNLAVYFQVLSITKFNVI